VTYAYNADGTLQSKTDAKGQQIQYTYDSFGRVTAKHTFNASGTEDLCGKMLYYWDTVPRGVGGSGWTGVSGRLMAQKWSDPSCASGQFTYGFQYNTGQVSLKRLYAPPLAPGGSGPVTSTLRSLMATRASF